MFLALLLPCNAAYNTTADCKRYRHGSPTSSDDRREITARNDRIPARHQSKTPTFLKLLCDSAISVIYNSSCNSWKRDRKGWKCILYFVKVKSYPWRVMTAFFASSHNTYSPHVCATRISQTCVKTVTYLIITWASLLWTTKSVSFSDFLSPLRLSSAAISCHIALQGPVYLRHLSLSTAGGSDFCTIGVNIEPWKVNH